MYFCCRAHNQWSRFFDDVDYVVPLSIWKIKLSTDIFYHEENWGTKHSSEDLRKFQENDPELSIIINWLESGNKLTESDLSLSSPAVKHLWLHRSQLSFRNNVLYYQWEDAMEPRCWHMGRDNTWRNIKKSFYWHNLYNDVATYVATCDACSKNKKANKRKRAGMMEYHAGSPMERVH